MGYFDKLSMNGVEWPAIVKLDKVKVSKFQKIFSTHPAPIGLLNPMARGDTSRPTRQNGDNENSGE
jgi:hypothetical protein